MTVKSTEDIVNVKGETQKVENKKSNKNNKLIPNNG